MGRLSRSVASGTGAKARLALAAVLCLFAANCTVGPLARMVDPKYGVAASPRVIDDGQPIPKGGGVYRVGNPYTIAGRTYVPGEDPDYRAEGIASWYGSDFHGRRTANGEIYDMHSISAAHPTLPIPSYVRVTNIANKRSLIVRVNDRGPFKDNRIIDLSSKTAELLGFRGHGLARVRVEYVGRASLDGSDDRKLIATLRHGQPAPAPSAVLVASTGGPFVPAAPDTMPARRIAQVPSPAVRPFELGRYPVAVSPAPVEPAGTQLASASPVRASIAADEPASLARGAIVTPASYNGTSVIRGRGLY